MRRGFDRFYGTIHGAGSYWDPSSLVRDDQLITIGIRPEYPETGYGYITKGKPIAGKTTTHSFIVKRFIEKPTLAAARRLIGRQSLWNSGIFVWKEIYFRFDSEILRDVVTDPGAGAGF